MILSCFLFAFELLINVCTADEVYLQVTVKGVIGGSAVLPCSSSKNEHNLQDINVLWKHNDSINVYAVLDGSVSVEHQDPKYRNRAESFPGEFVKGDFSVKLKNLTHTDAGKYKCYITHSSELAIVSLFLDESTGAKEKQPADKGNQAEETKLMLKKILIPCSCAVLVLLCIAAFIVCKMKGCDKTSSSGVSDTNGVSVL